MNKNWHYEDIIKLRLLFLQGHHIKAIAKELGRTVTALNKAISRFGMRDHGSKPFEEVKTLTYYMSLDHRPKKISSDTTQSKGVEFNVVIHFLTDQGISIQYINGSYVWGYDILNQQQILLRANQMRIDQGLPIFCVSYLTR
jgi:hypothetical protein